MGKPPLRAIAARRLNITDALKANIRHRYEQTEESLSMLAADLGCTAQTVCNLAKREGWLRYVPPPRDLSKAARLLARAERSASCPLIPAQAGIQEQDGSAAPCGAGSPLARGRTGEEVVTPTPDPSPQGEGEENAARAVNVEQIADTAEELHALLRKELDEFKAERAQLRGQSLGLLARERAARTLAGLTRTLHIVQAMRCGAPLSESHNDNAYDDMPADLDEFRDALARRIDAFVASRTQQRDGGDAAADGAADAAS